MAQLPKSGTLTGEQGCAPRVTVAGLLRLIILWRWRLHTRRELSTLTSEQMRDTGLDPELVWRERKKPFWQA